MLICADNIRKIYSMGETEVSALRGVSVNVEKGEFVAIVGASGSGKSTLMNILGCLDTPTSGQYILDGKNVTDLDDKEISNVRNEKIGFIFQGFNLIPTLTAFENVEMPLLYRHISKHSRNEIVVNALEKVGLLSRKGHRPSQLSGGQQQRVAIARAIAASPSIILADEPCGNLDSKAGAGIMELLHSLNREGKTIILITHDENAAKTASRIIRVCDGMLA